MLALNMAQVAHKRVPLFELWLLSFKDFGALKVLSEVLNFSQVCSYGGLDLCRADLNYFVTQSLQAWVILVYLLLASFRVDW